MVVVQVRDVPKEVHESLTSQARLEGKSLNSFLLEQLRLVARRGRNAEILARAHARPGKRPPPGEGTRLIRAQRDALEDLE